MLKWLRSIPDCIRSQALFAGCSLMTVASSSLFSYIVPELTRACFSDVRTWNSLFALFTIAPCLALITLYCTKSTSSAYHAWHGSTVQRALESVQASNKIGSWARTALQVSSIALLVFGCYLGALLPVLATISSLVIDSGSALSCSMLGIAAVAFVYSVRAHLIPKSGKLSVIAASCSTVIMFAVLSSHFALSVASGALDLSIALSVAWCASLCALVTSDPVISTCKPLLNRVNAQIKRLLHKATPESRQAECDVCFSRVSYREDGSNLKILDNVSLRIPTSSTVAFIVENDSQRRIIIELLLKIRKPSEGGIAIGSKSIYSHPTLHLMSLISKHIPIFKDTFKFNLVHNAQINRETFETILDLTSLKGVSESLPEKESTIIDDTTYHMITSYSKCIALARAIVGSSKIVVVDDMDFGLPNPDDEASVRTTLQNFLKGKTTLIITQDPFVARLADHVYLFNNGSIADEGSYDALMSDDGMCDIFHANHVSQDIH